MNARRAVIGATVAMLCTQALHARQTADALAAYWRGETAAARHAAGRALVSGGIAFDDARRLLEEGRPYRDDVPTGRIDRVHTVGGLDHHFVALIPESYDPATRYPVRFYLHGGVGRGAWEAGGAWWRRYDRLESDDHIAVVPAAWNRSAWWQATQAENLDAILQSLKREYNVDENRVHMIGISDGGSGAYFFAFRAPDRWAGFLPFIGHPAVLANPRVGPDGEMYVTNLAGQAFFVVSGETDRLYPARVVAPFVELFRELGARVTFRRHASGHNTEWWPSEAPNIERFIATTVRNPLPDTLDWETELVSRYNRRHWVVIDSLGVQQRETDALRHPESDPFRHESPSGRVRVVREGNGITVSTRGVRQFTLLVSPDQFDFSRSVAVTVNGRRAFGGWLTPDASTLLKWASRDDDRSALFGAELTFRNGELAER